MIKQYKILYQIEEQQFSSIVEADSKDDAIIKSSVEEEDITSIERYFSLSSNEISIDNQINILGSLYSASISGQNINKALVNSVELFYPKSIILDNSIALSKSGLSTSDVLQSLKFDIVATRLISAGELAGSLDEGILEAEKYLELHGEVQKISQGGLVSALPFLFIGLGMFLMFPIILGDVIRDIITEESANFFTNMLVFINVNLQTVILSIVGFVGLIFYIKVFHWDRVKGIFPFSSFEALFLLQNAIVFLSIYSTLYRRGIEVAQIVEIYDSVNPKIAKQLSAPIQNGENLSTAIMDCDFPEDWKKVAASVIDFENRDAKNKAIESLFTVLKKRITIQAQKSSGLLALLGKILLLLALLMVLTGFYFPAMLPKGEVF